MSSGNSRVSQLAEFLKGGMDIGAKGFGGAVDAMSKQSGLDNTLKQAQLNALEQERNDRATERYSQAVDKSGVPQVAPALETAEKSFAGKSVGPIMNMLPTGLQGIAANIKSRAGEMLNVPEWKGAGEEFQDLQRLMNIDTRAFAGAAQTKFEQAKQEVEKGLQAGASPEQVRSGIQKMRDSLNENARNVIGGARPQAAQEYEKRGGMSLSDLIRGKSASLRQTAGAPAAGGLDPAKAARLQELRAKRDAGGI